ncbi:hypothetical protein AVEN_58202-1 [Araneus ventricosus]|uniref:Uncharacterized protein n=1 Tax=Araneus ventricosus TaxID=182803 RepID=A0A4Y2MD39_ARAVE|nr:hypothetical protein AVEN_58202-1 [Araneus ventricosus]
MRKICKSPTVAMFGKTISCCSEIVGYGEKSLSIYIRRLRDNDELGTHGQRIDLTTLCLRLMFLNHATYCQIGLAVRDFPCPCPFNRFCCRNGIRHVGMGRRSDEISLIFLQAKHKCGPPESPPGIQPTPSTSD